MWHAYAKLRLHTDTTLNNFRILTSTLGKSVRIFIKEVCSQYHTTELPKEMATRGRREAALAKNSDTPKASKKRRTSLRKELNLSTYKYHALGDYPDLIARFGTTDNASTQMVRSFFFSKIRSVALTALLLIWTQGELQHKMIKRCFARTNRRKYTAQLAAAEIRERFMRRVEQRIINHARLSRVHQHRPRRRKRAQAESDEDDAVDSLDSTQRYDIADTTKEKENILHWVHANCSDIATKV